MSKAERRRTRVSSTIDKLPDDIRDVRSNVTDGLLGFATATGDGLHIKIGVSPSVTEKPITILGSMGASTIKSKLGLSPLADAVMDAVQGGAARVFCIPVAASTAGTIGEVTKTGDGGGSVTVQGSPNNAYALTVRFTAQGGLNTAAFVYSIDGDNFSDEITVPVTGSYEIEGTGLTIKFAEASSPDQKPSSFLVRDTYTLKTTAPSMTNGDVLGAIEKIKSFSEEFEFVHIVGESTVELWEAVSEAQKELMTVCHKPCFFLMEAAYPADEADGDLSDWALKMEADRKRIKNSDIQVCAAWGRLVRLDGTTQIVNLAGLASGRYAMTKVSVSIGKTKDEDALGFPKTKLLELVPIGYDSTVIELLDVAGYMTFREYDGLDDIFVYHTKMMCKDGSDFRYAEDVRVKNKIIRETRKKALQFKNDDIDLEDIQGELDARAKFISVPLDRMVEDKEISSYETTVDESCYDTFLEDETMSVIIRYQATLGQQETIELTREKWLSLTNGQHQLRIEAVDGNFATSVRVFSFSKKETVIKFELVAPEETDAAATKVLVTPTWKIEGAVAKVEACNNGFDAVPTWEDITAMVQINRVYNFTNKTKTASKWGVNIRFTITKNEGFEGEVSISGFGGAYE